MEKRKHALSLFWSCCLFVVLMGCSNSEITNRVPGKYLLNGNLSDETDANGFAYYLDDGEAYVARGANTDTSPVVPASVTLGGVVYPVTGVYHNGFAKSNITSIDLPLSIKTIDYQAFAGSALTGAVIPCNVEAMGSGAYMNCHQLAVAQFKNDESKGSITIGVCGGQETSGGVVTGSSHLAAISDYCFFNDENLTTVALPQSLTTVKSSAFSCCTSLKKMAFLSHFTTLEKYAFESCTALEDVYLPNSFTSASNDTSNCDPHAFYRAKASCIIHLSSLTSSAYDVWYNATAWRRYNDGNNVLTLAARETSDIGLGSDYLYRVENGEATLFSYAPSSFPDDGVVVMPNMIDGYAVAKADATTYAAYKTQIEEIYLSHNLREISNSFFDGWTALQTISTTGDGCYVPTDNVIDLSGMVQLDRAGQHLFNNATYMNNTFAGRLILPSCLRTIDSGAFRNLKKATSIEIDADDPSDSQLELIGELAFESFGANISSNRGDSLSNYFSLTLPASCTSINYRAFNGVCGLKKIEFLGASGKSLSIGNQAFYRCHSLSEIIFPKEDDSVAIAEKAFYQCSAGAFFGFSNISGIEEVYIPANVTSIGSKAFGNNERAIFYFESTNPTGVHSEFNYVAGEKFKDQSDRDGSLYSKHEASFIGYLEHAPTYYGVGYMDGSTSSKRRYLRTEDFGFVETAIGSGEFICAKYLYRPENLAKNAHVTVTVPERIKYSVGGVNPCDGETGASTDFKVLSIGDSCFAACYSRGGKYLSSVNVPHAIVRIGDNAFARSIFFYQLNSYTGNTIDANNFPSSLKYIGRSAFIMTRLRDALNIPGDVLTFDMIDETDLANQRTPINYANLDNASPRLYSVSEAEPRRYSTIFANDWFLRNITFTTVANPNFAFDSSIGAFYRLRKISVDGNSSLLSDDIQLLMVKAKLKDTYLNNATADVSANNANNIDIQDITLGDNTHPFMSGMTSIHYGAFKIATWFRGLILDTAVDIFPRRWNSTELLPQNLFLGRNQLKTYADIGEKDNDYSYAVAIQTLRFKNSAATFALPNVIARCCTNLTSLEIPNNLTVIPQNAFDRAESISIWTTPNASGVLAVGGETGRTRVLDLRYNTNLTKIGESSFYGAKGIDELYLGSSLTSIEQKAWYNATSIQKVDMSSCTSLTSALNNQTFLGCTSLTEVALPPNITTILNECFSSAPITSLTWPSGNALTKLETSCFKGNRLEVLEIPDSVETIGKTVFQDGTATTIVRLPTSLSKIDSTSFSNNTALNQVYFSDARTSRAAAKVTIAEGTFGPNVKYAIIPNFVTFASKPFKTCTALQGVFYGRKYSEISASETTKGLATYNNNASTATLYYYAESVSDMTADVSYWRYKGSSKTIVEVITKNGDTITPVAEYDFSTYIS